MSDRQLQSFFLKFALGVSVILALELTSLHKLLSIGLIVIIALFTLRGWAIACAWKQLAEHDQRQREYGFYGLQDESSIDREALILDTYDFALWLLPALMAIGFWLPAHWGELLHAVTN
jgi:hypothetical protein